MLTSRKLQEGCHPSHPVDPQGDTCDIEAQALTMLEVLEGLEKDNRIPL